MKPVTKSYLVLSLIVLVAVSCGPVTPVAIAAEILPTRTVAPTHTNTPAPSPMATLSQVEKIFVVPTMQPYLDTTPTPIASPVGEISLMRLRDLSEDDYLDLIYSMNEYSHQNFPPHYDWWSEGKFISSQEPVALAIQEYLYRFPESPNADRLRWQLAFINSIMYDGLAGNRYGDEWLIAELEKRLNRGETSPGQLRNILDRYWFDVTYVQPVKNLFGDNVTGWLYQVAPLVSNERKSTVNQSSSEGSMFFVVRENKGSEFKIYLLNSAWNLSFGESYVFEVVDHNRNGIPEVALYDGVHSGTICGGNLLIYEWRIDAFVEITKNNIYLRDCGEDFEYSVVDNVPAIIYHGFMPRRMERYAWNGEYYEFAGYESASLVDKWRSATGSFPEEAEAIEAILSSGDTKGISLSQTDFLRFRLGIVYALNSDPTQAKQILQELIEHPVDKTRTIYSDFATNFLQYYSDNKSLLLACRKSREFYDTVTDSFENEEDLLGIPFDFIFGPGLLGCFDRDVFELLVAEIPVTVEDIPAELRNYGVNLYYVEKQDVNLDDSVDEWLMAFDNDIFVVIPNGNNYEAVLLGDFWYDEEAYQYSTAELKIERWMGIQNPILTVKTDQELSI